MSEHSRFGVRRLVSFSAYATFGLVVGFSTMILLISSVTEPGKLGMWNAAVAVAFTLVSAATGVVATVGLGAAIDRMFRPHQMPLSAEALSHSRRIDRWRQVVAVFSLLCGGVLFVTLLPVLVLAFERLGPLPITLIVGAVGLAAAKPRTLSATCTATPGLNTRTTSEPVTGS